MPWVQVCAQPYAKFFSENGVWSFVIPVNCLGSLQLESISYNATTLTSSSQAANGEGNKNPVLEMLLMIILVLLLILTDDI